MSKRRNAKTKPRPEQAASPKTTRRDDEALARHFFIAMLAGVAVGGIGGWFYYGSQGATVGAVLGAVLGVGVLFGFLSLARS